MSALTKSKLLSELESMLEIVKECPENAEFNANVEFVQVDPEFLQRQKLYMIKKEEERQTIIKNQKVRGKI